MICVTSIPFSGRARTARRGVTLAEGILYLALSFSVIVFSAQSLVQERQRQDATLLAAELRQYIGSTQAYVSRNYSTLLTELVAAPNDDLAMEIPLDRLRAEGYLPSVFTPGTGPLAQVHGQEYAILARAVLRNDAADPKATVAEGAVLDPDGAILAEFVDGVATGANDELDLEVMLVSRRIAGLPAAGVNDPGGPIGGQVGNRVVAAAEAPSAGFISDPDANDEEVASVAIGPYGAWQLDLAPFRAVNGNDDLLDRSGPGHFGAMIALSNYGVLRSNPENIVEEFVQDESLSRCGEVPVGSEAHADCVEGSGLYDSVVFNAWNRGTDDEPDMVHPGLQGVGGIEMSTAAGAPAAISNLRRLDMTGDEAAPAMITGLGAVSSPAGGLALSGAGPDGAVTDGGLTGVGSIRSGAAGLQLSGLDEAGAPTDAALRGIGSLQSGQDGLRLSGVDGDGDATDAALRGVGSLRSGADGLALSGLDGEGKVVAAAVRGVGTLTMTKGRIEELFGISCLAGGKQDVLANGLSIDCAEVQVSGRLVITPPETPAGATPLPALAVRGTAEVDRLTVAGMPADSAILAWTGIVEFAGNAPIKLRKPECAAGYQPRLVTAPLNFEADTDKGSAYDRGTEVEPGWFETAAAQKNAAWPMDRHENKTHPGQLVGVATRVEEDSQYWKINLQVTRRPWFNEVSTATEDNPGDARMFVQTLCSRDGSGSPVVTGQVTASGNKG